MEATFSALSRNRQVLNFIRSSAMVALLFSFLLCVSICPLFMGFQLSFNEMLPLFIKILLVTWSLIVLLKIGFTCLVWTVEKMDRKLVPVTAKKIMRFKTILILLAIPVLLFSCKDIPMAGISKDLGTGMVTTYSKIKPASSVIVMNDEKLNHTQIPLGEKFIVYNNGVEGLVVKDNKVAVGCSLKITDKKGKTLLDETDLFKDGGGIYNKNEVDHLKCTVSTGKPMDWDQEYDVVIKFWDKNGSGTIENKLTISMIDIP